MIDVELRKEAIKSLKNLLDIDSVGSGQQKLPVDEIIGYKVAVIFKSGQRTLEISNTSTAWRELEEKEKQGERAMKFMQEVNIISLRAAFLEGRIARAEEKAIDKNPYTGQLEEEWQNGWESKNDELSR